ncbi:T9SS C-terminal target domain-containing protein [Chryseobacterium piperi]|nr:T9SS type A sorting domain-containing protein [Chryseobacterium piperi]ASW74804.1 T9SS C-terminal target domain-containing protein [Chryseobacterium piperi]
MRKSLFAIGLLAISYSVQAQILCHVDTNANMYVSKGTLVYSGGGVQMKANGAIENHGNFMISGSSTDAFRTIDASNSNKTEANAGNNFVNKLNEPNAYASVNPNNTTDAPVYTYGQLFITGVPQANITGFVDEEFRQVSHGKYQQIGMPFFGKTANTLNSELGKGFSNTRRLENDILYWDNTNVQFVNLTNISADKFGQITSGAAYWIFGAGGGSLNLTQTRTVKGVPLSDQNMSFTLNGAGANKNFGTNGTNTNSYRERYNSYLQDGFHVGTAWTGSFGKNWYQFSNPFFTNLDLTNIARNEGANGDGVNLTNIQGVRLEVSGVQYNPNSGGGSTSYKFITFDTNGGPVGDLDYTVIRPMGTFAIKLKDNTQSDVLNLANLRRFNYNGRAATTDYNVTASRSMARNTSAGTTKQLGVIALNAAGNEIGRTYYAVFPTATTGNSLTAMAQSTAASSNIIGTFEESLNGGYDNNFSSKYWLYINEANENDFQGKNVMMALYSNTIKSLRFEVRENGKVVDNGTHQLSSGVGFYYKATNGSVKEAKQGEIVPVENTEYSLYYGAPNISSARSLAATEVSVKPSRTMVVYNPDITNYVVRFDPDWKKADIEVYDMSGKQVISKKAVNTSSDFVIELDNSIKNSYIVKIISDKGETVNTKILK